MGSPAKGSMWENMAASGRQCGFDVRAEGFGRVGGGVALEHPAVAADEELGEVPLHRLRAEHDYKINIKAEEEIRLVLKHLEAQNEALLEMLTEIKRVQEGKG